MIISPRHRHVILNLKDPNRVMQVIPSARIIPWKGQQLVAVPHGVPEMRILRNIGLDAPAPIEHYYDWPGRHTPFEHQKITSSFLTMNPRAFVLSGLGTGKTLSALWAYDFLRQQGIVRKLLIVSPLSTLERAWGDEIFKNFPHLDFHVVHGKREKRHKLLKRDVDIYIINHDGFNNLDTLRLMAEMPDLDVVIGDECAIYRNHQTTRWKMFNSIINGNKKTGRKPKDWVWLMSGTPTPNAPTDSFGQIKLLTPGKVAEGGFMRYRELVMFQQGPYKWVPRMSAAKTVAAFMQPAIRFAREDCIDLPPTTVVERHAELTPDQAKAMRSMIATYRAEHEGQQISAVNGAVVVSKLIQIACGVAYGTTGEVHIPATSRIELVKEIIDQAEGKVLVFVPLTAPLLHLHAELTRTYGGTVALVYGDTSKSQRDDIFRDFQQKGSRLDIIVANPGTLSHGLTLTEANTIIWYAPIHSNEIYQQANGRIVRPGQRLNTLIVNIEGSQTERDVYDALQGKQRMQDVLLNLVKETATI
jgi:SNF2 family DNA or RNA helicase